MTTLEKLQNLISEQIACAPEAVTENKDIIKDLGCDSLDIVEMLMKVEDIFGFEVQDEDVPALRTIGDVVKFIDKKKK